MKRRQLSRGIDALDQRLVERQRRFRSLSTESVRAIRQLHPLWLIGAGLLSGFAVRSLGWRRIRHLGLAGMRIMPLGFRVGRGIARLGEFD